MLAQLWLDNPAIQQEIADASDQIEQSLAERPNELGIAVTEISRLVALLPIAILFRVVEEDRMVRVMHVKFWLE
jgi:hypothetical protein